MAYLIIICKQSASVNCATTDPLRLDLDKERQGRMAAEQQGAAVFDEELEAANERIHKGRSRDHGRGQGRGIKERPGRSERKAQCAAGTD